MAPRVVHMNPKAVTFDVYGTLLTIETDEESSTAFQVFCRWLFLNEVRADPEKLKRDYKEGFRRLEDDMVKRGIENPEVDVRDVLSDILGGYGRRRFVEEAALVFRAITTKYISVRAGVEATLKSLGVPLALVSNAQAAFTWPELRAFQLDSLFNVIVLSSEVGSKKPSAVPFSVALSRLGLLGREEEVVHVGDTYEADVLGAKAAGMKVVLIAKEDERRAGRFQVPPDGYLDPSRFEDLPDVIRGI